MFFGAVETIDRRHILEKFDGTSADVRTYLESLDDINLLYFSTLFEKRNKAPTALKSKMKLYDGKSLEPPAGVVVPTAVAPKTWMRHLPHVSYKTLLENSHEYAQVAQTATLWVKKTQAGGGTSILRKKYLSEVLNLPIEKTKLGAKGTDLYATLPPPFEKGITPLAEIQILQSLLDIQNKRFNQIYYQDIVSHETQSEVQRLWKKPCLLKPSSTYENISDSFSGFKHAGETVQALVPTINEKESLSLNRLSPGGHAFFAVEALWAALENTRPITTSGGPLISVIGNGEDLGSTPDPSMVGWMVKHQVAIVMITTEKTEVDLKGGQIALEKNAGENFTSVCLIEQAQAKEMGQLELFEKLGLEIKKPGQMALFNTNVALFNYETLVPKMKTLFEKVGMTEFLKIISPTLISNKKSQKDEDGVYRTYDQLEGAMGSVLLNLDRAWRRQFNEPIVSFINVEREYRAQFFSPVKTAFDFFMQFYSDRFSFDPDTLRLKNHRPGSLPGVILSSPADPEFYSEVHNILRVFKNVSIKKLDSLKVTGVVNLKGLTLQGQVTINYLGTDEFNLSESPGIKSRTLENCSIQITDNGKVIVRNDIKDEVRD